ncbi:hypothetical protein U8326_14465 [Tsuneonella sp. CC-YZS046]|uniref:hypothetical protein n=1 Tax=Tsuneonella sp. CC-YZS046 TaxID=3042152 RepID=UPI002D77B211|nr:hypothetical protein [Tsuneonella sp. CC-YZS046]WRO66226.1 hypothetical protein U8326_14465 [Tsuneonella sp. CC-YZS046]
MIRRKFRVKAVFISTALGLLATPASAEVIHRASVVHEGRTINLSYEPKVETSLRQAGIGPRTPAICLWKSRIAIHRAAATPEGEPIAALSRVVEEMPLRNGSRRGHCSTLQAGQSAEFQGSPEELRKHLTQAAGSDALALRRELRDLALLSAEEVQKQ